MWGEASSSPSPDTSKEGAHCTAVGAQYLVFSSADGDALGVSLSLPHAVLPVGSAPSYLVLFLPQPGNVPSQRPVGLASLGMLLVALSAWSSACWAACVPKENLEGVNTNL